MTERAALMADYLKLAADQSGRIAKGELYDANQPPEYIVLVIAYPDLDKFAVNNRFMTREEIRQSRKLRADYERTP